MRPTPGRSCHIITRRGTHPRGRSFRLTVLAWEPIVGRSVTLPRRSLLLGGRRQKLQADALCRPRRPARLDYTRRQPPRTGAPTATHHAQTSCASLSGSAKRRKKRGALQAPTASTNFAAKSASRPSHLACSRCSRSGPARCKARPLAGRGAWRRQARVGRLLVVLQGFAIAPLLL